MLDYYYFSIMFTSKTESVKTLRPSDVFEKNITDRVE